MSINDALEVQREEHAAKMAAERITEIRAFDPNEHLTREEHAAKMAAEPITEIRAFDPNEHLTREEHDLLVRHAVTAALAGQDARVREAVTSERARGEERMEEFKRLVAQRAQEVAEEHDWCSVAENLVTELGMQWPQQTHTYDVTITLRVEASRSPGGDSHTAEFFKDSQSFDTVDDDNIDRENERTTSQKFEWTLDDDWRNIQIKHVETQVVEVD